MKQTDMTINHLPVKTWNHLHMNETNIGRIQADGSGAVNIRADGSVSSGWKQEMPASYRQIKTGAGEAVDALAQNANIQPVQYTFENNDEHNVLQLELLYKNGDSVVNQFGIAVSEGGTGTVFADYASEERAEGMGVSQIKLYAARNATLRMIQILHVDDTFSLIDDIGGVCEEGARIELIQLFLNAGRTYAGCEISLKGDGSGFVADIGYQATRRQRIDMNYVARHIGKRTVSRIDAGGSLKEEAFKLFRGTIDFINGSAGAVGNEKEDILLIDEGVVNQTIPLILCAEEDVVGNHGATIGRPDEDTLFYLASRGIPKETAYQMLAKAKLEAVCGKIQNEDIKKRVVKIME